MIKFLQLRNEQVYFQPLYFFLICFLFPFTKLVIIEVTFLRLIK